MLSLLNICCLRRKPALIPAASANFPVQLPLFATAITKCGNKGLPDGCSVMENMAKLPLNRLAQLRAGPGYLRETLQARKGLASLYDRPVVETTALVQVTPGIIHAPEAVLDELDRLDWIGAGAQGSQHLKIISGVDILVNHNGVAVGIDGSLALGRDEARLAGVALVLLLQADDV